VEQKQTVESCEESDDDDEEWPCLVCCEPFKNSREKNGYVLSVVNVGLMCCVLDLTVKQKPMCVTTVTVTILSMIRLACRWFTSSRCLICVEHQFVKNCTLATVGIGA